MEIKGPVSFEPLNWNIQSPAEQTCIWQLHMLKLFFEMAVGRVVFAIASFRGQIITN